MDFEVSIDEHHSGYSVVSVRGEVDLNTSPRLHRAIERGAGRARPVVLETSGISFMDSTALSTFLQADEDLRERGVSLRIAAPSQAVERILGVTGLKERFEVYPTVEAAAEGGR